MAAYWWGGAQYNSHKGTSHATWFFQVTSIQAWETWKRITGLAPHIQEQVGAHIQGDLSAAITMAERLDLFRTSAQEGGGSSG